MRSRLQELAERQAALQLRSAAQRGAIAAEIDRAKARLATVDRVAVLVRAFALNPIVVAAGAAVLITVGRGRALQLVGRVLLLATTARRLLRAVRML